MEDLGSIPELGRSPGGRHGNPLQYSCLENPQGQRSLVGYSPWGHKKSDTTERIRHTQFSSVAQSDSLRHHGLQHTRLPCPSPTPGVHSNSYPLSRWCHPTISFSVVPFSSCLRSFLASRSFSVSSSHQVPKYWRFSFKISPSNEYWGLISFRMDWLDLLAVQGTLKRFLHTTAQKHQFVAAQLSL